jgi:hypothetical protein
MATITPIFRKRLLAHSGSVRPDGETNASLRAYVVHRK